MRTKKEEKERWWFLFFYYWKVGVAMRYQDLVGDGQEDAFVVEPLYADGWVELVVIEVGGGP